MYKVKFTKSVIKQFSKLQADAYGQVFSGIISLLSDPFSSAIDVTKLTDFEGYRLRIGDYRVLYTINTDLEEIIIKAIVRRKDAYKKKK